MPGLYPLLEIKPNSAVILITNRCILKCIMCKQWQAKEPSDELMTEEWKEVFRKLKNTGIKNIHFTGGEPFLRPDMNELIQYSTKIGMRAGLTTNGYLLDRSLLEDAASKGLRFIAISVDATGDDFEAIRGVKGSYEKVRNACKLISEFKRKGKIKAGVNFTLMKRTLKTFGSVRELADSLGLPIDICLLDNTPFLFDTEANRGDLWINDDSGREFSDFLHELKLAMADNPSSFNMGRSGVEYISNYFKDPLQKKIPCAASQERIFIAPNGDILGGCLSMGSFGNIMTGPIDKVVGSDRYRKAKRDMLYKICPGCSCGYIANIAYHLPSKLKDIL